MHEGDGMNSGDFLRVKYIIIDLETDEIRLRGHRLRRTKYLGQVFDCEYTYLSKPQLLVRHTDRM
jgi:DNA (cytosine-5)-methyltransferase 1